MSKDTGGPAFPTARVNINGVDEQDGISAFDGGMSLRDYFAAQVAVGAMSAYWNGDRMQDPTFGDIAQQAYGIADAMLEARKV